MSGTANFISPYSLGNLLAPVDGTTHGAVIELSLTGNSASFPISSIQQVMGNFQPQSMMVDNSNNSTDLIVNEQIFGWTFRFPAGTNNWINFPSVNNALFNFSASGVNTSRISFFDFPALPFGLTNNSNANGAPVTIANQPIDVNLTSNIVTVLPTDKSVVSVVNLSSSLLAQNTVRKYLLIQAPTSAPIYLNMTGGAAAIGAAGTVELLAGGIYECAILVNGNAINYLCTVAGLTIVCYEG